jgi:hypothetical protein
MKEEYDFSDAEQGKFHRAGATLVAPVYLEPDVLSDLQQRAAAHDKTLNDMVNTLLRADIALLQAAG